MKQLLLKEVLPQAALAAVYFAAARLGLSLAIINDSTSAVWPATGIALAAVILHGPRTAIGIFAGAFAANQMTNGTWPALGIAAGNVAEALAGGLLVRRFAGGANVFERAEDTFRFVGIAAIAAPAIAATVGAAVLRTAGLVAPGDVGSVWLTWWLGDGSGAVLVTPLVVLWSRPPKDSPLLNRPLEGFLLLMTTVAAAMIVFGAVSPAARSQFPVAFLCVPSLIWAAFRFGPREAATCTAILATVAIAGTHAGFGPYAAHGPGQGLLMLQAFIAMVTIASVAGAAEACQRRQREADLRTLNEELERRVSARTMDLQRLQARLAEAQQVAHAGSWEWDIATNSVWWSDELFRIFGASSELFPPTYERFLHYTHPDERAMIDTAVRGALRQRRPFAFEHRVIRPDGGERFVIARGEVIVNPAGEPIRMCGTVLDITERRRAEQAQAALRREHVARIEAEEANRLKDQFLATLSHELRTPLHAVIGWSQMLMKGMLAGERQTRAVELIYRNALLQSQMITDLLDVSRITSGGLTLESGLVDLPAILEAAVEAVRPAAIDKGVSIAFDVVEAAWLHGDAKRLAQVANNLLANAIKFTPAGGSVVVVLLRRGESLEISVEDTGPGIAPEFLPHIFERFRQEDASATREHGGLGLGLSIVRHIVELHGGTVTAANRSGRSGAVLTVTLPALSAQAVAGLGDSAVV